MVSPKFFRKASAIATLAFMIVAQLSYAQEAQPEAKEVTPKAAPQPAKVPPPPKPKPQPQPVKPQPQPVKPQPQPVKPQPQPVKPQPQPVKPQPQPVKPQPQPVKPQPQPVKPQPQPVKPQPQPVKPVSHQPQPVTHPEPTTPTLSPGQLAQKQQEQKTQVQQAQEQRTQQDLATLKSASPAVAAKIPPGAHVKLSANGASVAVKKPDGTNQVLDAKTGKPLVSYTKTTGATATTPPAGATTKPNPGGGTIVTAPGYQRVVDTKGNATTTVNNTVIKETIVNNTTVINESVTINHQVVVVHPNYPVVRTWDPVGGGYVSAYRPTWWGTPVAMQTAWVYQGPHPYHVYGLFFGVPGYEVEVGGYQSPWNPGVGYVSWENNPYSCDYNCWGHHYSGWGWGWYGENYYPGYYTPFQSYNNMGWFVTDYRIQRELETERMERLAAYEDAEFEAAEQRDWAINAVVLNDSNDSLDPGVFQTLVDQDQELVNGINTGAETYAPWMVNQNHVFTVSTTTPETVINPYDGNEYRCKLKAGEFIQPDPDFEQDVEPIVDPSTGFPQLDQFGNVEYTTYVTMKVVGSRRHSCKIGSDLVVQMSTLQSMLDDEKARVQEAMEQSIVLGIHP
jgi:hypothetical protein